MEAYPYLKEFTSYIIADKGLAKNTVLAYTSDLKRYFRYLANAKVKIREVKRQDLTEYLWKQKQCGLQPRSLYRMIETLRQFHRFLLAESHLTFDPTENLIPPRVPAKLPGLLTVWEVEKLLNSINGDKE
ncbi:MAG: site-specific integrase, partial [Candidatus Firestonebacteria bacterium]